MYADLKMQVAYLIPILYQMTQIVIKKVSNTYAQLCLNMVKIVAANM